METVHLTSSPGDSEVGHSYTHFGNTMLRLSKDCELYLTLHFSVAFLQPECHPKLWKGVSMLGTGDKKSREQAQEKWQRTSGSPL